MLSPNRGGVGIQVAHTDAVPCMKPHLSEKDNPSFHDTIRKVNICVKYMYPHSNFGEQVIIHFSRHLDILSFFEYMVSLMPQSRIWEEYYDIWGFCLKSLSCCGHQRLSVCYAPEIHPWHKGLTTMANVPTGSKTFGYITQIKTSAKVRL